MIKNTDFLVDLIKDTFRRFKGSNASDWLFNAVACIAVQAYRKGVEDGRKLDRKE